MRVLDWPLPYVEGLAERRLEQIEGVVIHCTELPDLATARAYGERVLYPDSSTGASGHYYLDRDGSIECWVPMTRVAHHCRGYNAHTVGLELVNLGRYPDWLHAEHQAMQEPYPEAQIQALIELLGELRRVLPRLYWLAGHEDLDREWVPSSDRPELLVRRKLDPGPHFPWARVLAGHPGWSRYLPEGSGPEAESVRPATKRART